MKNIRFLYDNWFDDTATTITASSEEVLFPKENLQDYRHTIFWQSTGASSEWIKWDFGSAKDVKAFVLKYHNFSAGATVKIQANSSDSWSSPPVDETLSIVSGQMQKMWDSAQSYRWWRLTMEDSGNPDGYLRVGRIFSGNWSSPSVNFDWKRPWSVITKAVSRDSTGGQRVARKLADNKKLWRYRFGFFTASDVAIIEDVLEKCGRHKPFFIVEDADDADNTLYYVWLLNESNDFEPSDVMHTRFAVSLDLEEAL